MILYSNLVKDLKRAFISTGDSRIESLFISASIKSAKLLRNWLNKNSQIKSTLSVPSVYDVLKILSELINNPQIGVSPTKLTLIKYFMNNPGINLGVSDFDDVVLAMSKLLDEKDSSLILGEFRDLIIALSSLYQSGSSKGHGGSVDVKGVYEDLSAIQEAFFKEENSSIIDSPYSEIAPKTKAKRLTKKESIRIVFASLLRMCTSEIKNALSVLGQRDLKSLPRELRVLKNNLQNIIPAIDRGVLAHPFELNNVIKLNSDNSDMRTAAGIVKMFSITEGVQNYNFEVLKRSVMKHIDLEQF